MSRALALTFVVVLAACGDPDRRDRDDVDSNDAGPSADAGSTSACDPNPCTEAHRTKCRVSGRAAVCSCDEGYADRDGECVEVAVDVCSPNPCTVEPHATICLATTEGPRCECEAGYHREGSACVADESDVCSPNPCTEAHRTTCNVGASGAVCSCDQGYEDRQGTCVASSGDVCSPNPCTAAHRTTCTAGASGAVCSCDEGYEERDGACVLRTIDACSPNPCTGAHKTQCTSTNGQATCSCDPGYVAQGSACVPASCSGGVLATATRAGEVASSSPSSDTVPVWTGAGLAVLWSEDRLGQGTEIYAAKLGADGTKVGTDVRLTMAPGDSDVDEHAVVPLPNGFALAWVDARFQAQNQDVVFARFDQNLARVGAEQRITTNRYVEHVALAATTGGFVVAWAGTQGNPGTWAQRLDAAGAPQGQPLEISTSDADDLALASNGTAALVTFVGDGIHSHALIRADFTLHAAPREFAENAASTDVFWTGSAFGVVSADSLEGSYGGAAAIRLSSVDANGTVQVDSVQIGSSARGYWALSATWTGSTIAVVADTLTSTTSSASTARLHQYDAAGVALTVPQDVVTSAASVAFAVRPEPTGVAVTWRDKDAGGDENVYVRRWCR